MYWSACKPLSIAITALALLLPFNYAFAGPREQAIKMHNRIVGVPPTPAVLNQMIQMLEQSDPRGAAMLAMQNPIFYNMQLSNWVKPWSNQAEDNTVEVNDFVATVVGMIRDDVSFDQVLYGDILYTGTPNVVNNNNVDPYEIDRNDHFRDLERRNIDLSSPANLERRTQTDLIEELISQGENADIRIQDKAGVISTRAFASAYLSAGTNRRAVRYTFKIFMCRDLDQITDLNLSDFRVRRDVDRAPGGDPTVYRNRCVGCHTGLDGLAGAFAYTDFDGNRFDERVDRVENKFNQNNDVFPGGFVTRDNSWVNPWATGQNAALGFRGPASGSGVNSYGRMLAASDAFPKCMARKVHKLVCLEKPSSAVEQELADDFKSRNYNMKELFAKSITKCMAQ